MDWSFVVCIPINSSSTFLCLFLSLHAVRLFMNCYTKRKKASFNRLNVDCIVVVLCWITKKKLIIVVQSECMDCLPLFGGWCVPIRQSKWNHKHDWTIEEHDNQIKFEWQTFFVYLHPGCSFFLPLFILLSAQTIYYSKVFVVVINWYFYAFCSLYDRSEWSSCSGKKSINLLYDAGHSSKTQIGFPWIIPENSIAEEWENTTAAYHGIL